MLQLTNDANSDISSNAGSYQSFVIAQKGKELYKSKEKNISLYNEGSMFDYKGTKQHPHGKPRHNDLVFILIQHMID